MKFGKLPILEKNYSLDSYVHSIFEFKIKKHVGYALFVMMQKKTDILKYLNNYTVKKKLSNIFKLNKLKNIRLFKKKFLKFWTKFKKLNVLEL